MSDHDRWLSCRTPRLMFLDLQDRGKQGRISRELRLFACACCRRISEYLVDERSWRAVEIAEKYADGNASRSELEAAYEASALAEYSAKERIRQIHLARPGGGDFPEGEAWRLFEIDDWHPEGRRLNAARAAHHCADLRLISSNLDPESKHCGDWYTARAAALYAYEAGAPTDELVAMEAAFLAGADDYLMYEDAWQADLLRCVFRTPSFRPMAAAEIGVETRIRDLALSIYRLRTFERMPELVKMLEDAGSRDRDLLAHLFEDQVHARGCWALDTLIGDGVIRTSDCEGQPKADHFG